MDFSKLQIQLIKAIRGNSTQKQLSLALGLRDTQVYLWESGRGGCYWDDFVQLCELQNIPLRQQLSEFLDIQLPTTKSSAVVKAIIGSNKPDGLSKQIGVPKHTLYRWINGKSKPKLSDVLKLLYKCTIVLVELLASLTDIQAIPLLKTQYEQRKKEREFHYQYPLTGAVLRCLELTAYEMAAAHSDAFIAEHVGVASKEVAKLLKQAEAAGIVERSQEKFRIVNKALSTKGDRRGQQQILQYWLQRQMESELLGTPGSNNTSPSYIVLTTNAKTHKKIENLLQEQRRALFSLIFHDDNRAAADPLDRVVLVYNYCGNLRYLT